MNSGRGSEAPRARRPRGPPTPGDARCSATTDRAPPRSGTRPWEHHRTCRRFPGQATTWPPAPARRAPRQVPGPPGPTPSDARGYPGLPERCRAQLIERRPLPPEFVEARLMPAGDGGKGSQSMQLELLDVVAQAAGREIPATREHHEPLPRLDEIELRVKTCRLDNGIRLGHAMAGPAYEPDLPGARQPCEQFDARACDERARGIEAQSVGQLALEQLDRCEAGL